MHSLSLLFTILNAPDADSISSTLQEKYSHEIGVLSHVRASTGQGDLKLRLPFTNVFKNKASNINNVELHQTVHCN